MKGLGKYKRAIGLHYSDQSVGAPTVSIAGDHLLAEKIVREAKKQGVPIVENPVLVRALSRLRAQDEVPEDLFEAVALVLAHVEAAQRSY